MHARLHKMNYSFRNQGSKITELKAYIAGMRSCQWLMQEWSEVESCLSKRNQGRNKEKVPKEQKNREEEVADGYLLDEALG